MDKPKRIKIQIEVHEWQSSYAYTPILSIEDTVEGNYQREQLKEYGLSLIRDLRMKFSQEIGYYIDKENDKIEEQQKEE